MAEVTQSDLNAAQELMEKGSYWIWPANAKALIAEVYADARHRTDAAKSLVEALREVEPLLSKLAMPCRADDAVAPEVASLGRSIGYGNLMVTASALWRASLEGQGIAGGEFSPNICQKTAENAWLKVCAALRSAQQ